MSVRRGSTHGCRDLLATIVCAASLLPALTVAQVVTTCPAALETTQLFSYTGAPATFTVPANVSAVRIIAVGADGGERAATNAAGGSGAQVEGTFAVTTGQVFTVIAGESPPGGDEESGGGGASGAYLGATLAVIAGAGGGDDNTGNGRGATATNAGGNGGPSAGNTCPLGGLGGMAGAGGEFGELGAANQACQNGSGGAGGGGINSAGGTSAVYNLNLASRSGPSGGGACSIAGANGGTAGREPPGTVAGTRGGYGLCGGGGADERESGGGGGYSGGGGGPESAYPGGGGSFVAATATTPTLTAGIDGGGLNRNGSVRVCYTTRANLAVTKTDGVASRLSGATTTYTVVLTNAGPTSANGALFTDAAQTGLSCTSAVCSASGGAQCPGGAINGAGVVVPVASVQAGIAIPTLPNAGSVSFALTCTVTATGL